MDEQTDDLFDNVDAVFFTGDRLFDRPSLEDAKNYLKRWNKQIETIERSVDKWEKEDGNG